MKWHVNEPINTIECANEAKPTTTDFSTHLFVGHRMNCEFNEKHEKCVNKFDEI